MAMLKKKKPIQIGLFSQSLYDDDNFFFVLYIQYIPRIVTMIFKVDSNVCGALLFVFMTSYF